MGLLILGSSTNLPAHWEGEARTRKKINAAANREGMAEGGGEKFRHARANTKEGQPRRHRQILAVQKVRLKILSSYH
ncbi:MAG: hypothetical protein A3B04_02340 [Candidatus Portnoybacteria bacterium RIFCSPLOWO2_02_FULL_39_11]|uniref:Uncharacterized protein n=1 Tax=Candidatus Portnoybacteria bacterium RIFCSPLOWO2_02_FULL_39_11 TaxID=1802001 RepID=A0A1G2FSC5_9BACT|nr:MAG: hypothetical protein A3B04_02340 [Candidatus Portnoybacteria bacterium RIFCSPLOWO2_02_FULL_39_11]